MTDGFNLTGIGREPIPNMRHTLSSIKIKQRLEEDVMIHRIAKEVAQEYLEAEKVANDFHDSLAEEGL